MMKFLPRACSLLWPLIAISIPRLDAADAKEVIAVWPEGVPGLRSDAGEEKMEQTRTSNVHHPSLTVFSPPADKANGTAIIICPGGGYMRLSTENEGSLIAGWLNSIGVTAYMLKYRMQEYGHPAPLRDVLRAVRLVRSRAAALGVDPGRVGVLGASAGGHLTACAATLYAAPEGKTGAALDTVSARPDFVMLLYPVITMKGPFAHAGSRKALLGLNPDPDVLEHLSTELQITKDTPPAFIVATEDDATVAVENSLMFYQALHKAGVPAEMHLWAKGRHGFGMRPDIGQATTWTKRGEEWLLANGWLNKR